MILSPVSSKKVVYLVLYHCQKIQVPTAMLVSLLVQTREAVKEAD